MNKYISRMTRSVFSIVRVRSGTDEDDGGGGGGGGGGQGVLLVTNIAPCSLQRISAARLIGTVHSADRISVPRGFMQKKMTLLIIQDPIRHQKSYGLYCRFDRLFIFVMNFSLTLYFPAIVI